jgi:CDP-glycerol glycerophosphotransferase
VEGKRVVAYLPTARYLTVDEKDELAFTAGVLDPNALSRFAVENNMVIVIHLHYTMAADEMMAHVSSLPGFIVVAANTDLQPMLFMFDVVVTDYSTVYLDFLFFARPIVFFAWDREQYMQREGLLFNYDDITPGAVVATQDALFQALRESVSRNADDDPYAMLRVKLRDRVFVYTDGGSAARLLRYLERRFVNATHDELWHIPIDATDSVRRA